MVCCILYMLRYRDPILNYSALLFIGHDISLCYLIMSSESSAGTILPWSYFTFYNYYLCSLNVLYIFMTWPGTSCNRLILGIAANNRTQKALY